MEMYKVTDRVLDYYRTHAKQGKNADIPKYALAIKLSVLIDNNTGESASKKDSNKRRFRLGSFYMDVNMDEKTIYWIGWDVTRNSHLHPFKAHRIESMNLQYGLNKKGTGYKIDTLTA